MDFYSIRYEKWPFIVVSIYKVPSEKKEIDEFTSDLAKIFNHKPNEKFKVLFNITRLHFANNEQNNMLTNFFNKMSSLYVFGSEMKAWKNKYEEETKECMQYYVILMNDSNGKLVRGILEFILNNRSNVPHKICTDKREAYSALEWKEGLDHLNIKSMSD